MTDKETDALDRLLDRAVTVPRHVTFREFAQETVALDIETGKYFHLNPTAGRMFAALQTQPTVRDARDELLLEYPDAAGVLERDLCRLCLTLSKSGLLEIGPGQSPPGQ
jgi:hypothetical protein